MGWWTAGAAAAGTVVAALAGVNAEAVFFVVARGFVVIGSSGFGVWTVPMIFHFRCPRQHVSSCVASYAREPDKRPQANIR
jgi:hypothetical protein